MYMDQLKRGLEKEGHEVEILAKHPNLNGYYLVNSGKFINLNKIEKLVTNCINRSFSYLDPSYKRNEMNYYYFELAASYLNLEYYDLIHTQDIFSTRLLSRVKPKNTPLVASIHGCIATEYLIQKHNSSNTHLSKINQDFGWKYAHWQENIGASSSDKTIVATQWLKDLLINDFNVEEKQLTTIPYAQDIADFRKRMTEPPPILAPSDKTVIVCPARLSFIKGHKYLLEALAKLKSQHNNWVCWLVGDGNLRNELINMTRKLNLSNHVIFLGTQKNIPSILKQADICVLSSLQESFPYAIMEAQIAGIPAAVTDVGGLTEAVTHGQTGLISPKENSESLYRNIKELIENEHLRNTMAANAQKWAMEKWGLETMTAKTLAIYKQVIQTQNGDDVVEI
ncbi:glycosyltransferase family 4 protein [Bacillus sp. JJ634]